MAQIQEFPVIDEFPDAQADPSLDLVPPPNANFMPSLLGAATGLTAAKRFAGNAVSAISKPLLDVVPKVSRDVMERIVSAPAQIASEFSEMSPDEEKTPVADALRQAVPPDKAIDVATGVENAGADMLNFFTSPLGIATLGMGALPKAAQSAVSLAFATQMASETPEIARQLGTEFGKPEKERDYQKIAGLVTEAIATTGFTAAGVVHGAGKPLADKLGAYPGAKIANTAPPIAPTQPAEQPAIDLASTNEGLAEANKDAKPPETPQDETGGVPTPASPETPAVAPAAEAPAPEAAPVVAPSEPDPAPKPDEAKAPEAPPSFSELDDVRAKMAKGEPLSAREQQVFDYFGTIEPQGPGMGAAKIGEVGTGAGGDVYGVAARVREERAKAGAGPEVPPGEGISAPDSVERGRELISQGQSPENILSLFEKTKSLSSDDMAVVRAHGEDLFQKARQIEETSGTDSDEYRAARKVADAWDARTKPMQTEWHKMGQAQQGETDIDTGSFTGLAREHKQTTGKDFTPKQEKAAKAVADLGKKAKSKTDQARQDLTHHIKAESRTASEQEARTREIVQRHFLQRMVDEARAVTTERVRLAQAATERAEAARKIELERKAKLEQLSREAQSRFRQSQQQSKTSKPAPDIQGAIKAKLEVMRLRRSLQAEVDKANAETTERVRRAEVATKQAEAARKAQRESEMRIQRWTIQRALEQTKRTRRDLADASLPVWRKAKEYLEKGVDDFDDLRNKVATDLGLGVKTVTNLLVRSKRAKYLADDLWRKQQAERRLKQQAIQWLRNLDVPGYQRAIRSLPGIAFGLKVMGHGTVALGTHAPMVGFQPRFWNVYARNFVKMYRMVGNSAYYEQQMQDLLRRPNYTTARRAGLINDPFQGEDYTAPAIQAFVSKTLGPVADKVDKFTSMGNRGYSVLKVLRQDMFDQQWNKLPRTARIPEVAQAIADGLNHATGVVKGKAPTGSNIALFAPRLEASRVAWLLVDPVKSADIFMRWNSATLGEKTFAVNQVKEKAWVAGTLFGLLAINQGILSAVGSKQKVNFTDPMKGDFLKFKAAGMQLSYGNAMLTMARLPIRMYAIRRSDGGKLNNLIYPDENTYTVLGEYARSQLSPFASLSADLWLRSDWMQRQLPNSNRPMPHRLTAKGIKPYTWPEFWTEQSLPIPAEEAMKEVWHTGMGMSPEQVSQMRKMIATVSVMAATGARLTDDWDTSKAIHPPKP